LEAELSKGIHYEIEFRLDKIAHIDRKRYDLIYRAARPYITKTTEEIRKILEYRASMLERNLRRGRLDSGALWKLETSDCKVFCRFSQPNNVPRMALYLLVDCSGSMIYGDRMASAREAAVLMCEVCAALKIPVNVTGYTGAVAHDRDVVHRRVLAFDDPPDRKYAVAGLTSEKENRDGYSIRVAAREISLRPEPKKVLMVLSDGLPEMPYQDYYGPPAVRDTALAVREAEKSGLGVIGFYFGDKATLPQAQMIYPNLIYVQDVSVLPQAVARTLKKVISNL
jgi:nitric oxide reductase activation protein